MTRQDEIDFIKKANKWEHAETKKARERFKRPIPDYGKSRCKNDKN